MVDRWRNQVTPANVCKPISHRSRKGAGVLFIYVHQAIAAYNRKRLIEHKVPFVVPGNQMYLPMLGVDLREHYKKIRGSSPKFSPSTQAVVLHAIIHGAKQKYTPSGLSANMDYSSMTLSRTFDELESVGLGKVLTEGRERVLCFSEPSRELWEKAREFMRSPVKKRLWIRDPSADHWPGIKAGLSALADYSLLSPPNRPVYAISLKKWSWLKRLGDTVELPPEDHEACEMEIWSYSPQMFAQDGVVDKFSLYLTLQQNSDERVQAALEEMMGNLSW